MTSNIQRASTVTPRLEFVLQNFPVRSETFIVRSIEAAKKFSGCDVRVVVTGRFNHLAWSQLRGNCPALHEIEVRRARFGLMGFPAALMAFLTSLLGLWDVDLVSGLRTALTSALRAGRLGQYLSECRETSVLLFQFFSQAIEMQAVITTSPKGCNLPCIIAARGRDVTGPMTHTFSRAALRSMSKCNAIVIAPVTNSLKRHLVNLGFPEVRTAVVPSPIADLAETAHMLHGARDRKRFVFVGRLVEKKGLELALEAIATCRRQGLDIRLDVIGDGPLRGRLERLAASLGLSSSVRFHGHLENSKALEIMGHAGAVVIPSRRATDGDSEGIPNVAKEAALLGTIIIASDHGGLPELVLDGVTGFLFKQNDVNACERAIRRFLTQEDLDPMRLAALKRVQDLYSFRTYGNALNHAVQLSKERLL